MAFGVAAGEGAAAVVHVPDVEDHLGTGLWRWRALGIHCVVLCKSFFKLASNFRSVFQHTASIEFD
jgi:hypothetical protein